MNESKKKDAVTLDMTGIRERENGKWQARASYTNKSTGEVTRFNKSGFMSAIEAYNARQEFLKDMHESGSYSGIKKRRFGDVYLESIENLGYSTSTIKRKLSLYNNHIKKVFENRYINTIKSGDIEKFLVNLTKPTKDKKRGRDIKYSQEYILGFYKAFCAVFKYAWKQGDVSCNIMEKVDCNGAWFSKAKEKEEGRFLSPEELSVIDSTLKPSNLYPSFKIALHSGLRISEIFALTWNDIDFEKNLIRVSKQMQYDDTRKIWCLVSPKTKNSNRIVPMPTELVDFLKELRKKQLQDKSELGECYRDKNRVTGYYDKNGKFCKSKEFDFVNKKSTGERLTPDSTKYATRKVEATTGKHRFLLDPNDPTSDIDFSYHDFRHTYSTLCALNGVVVEDLQDMLGHSKITTTKRFYIHKDPENNPRRDKCVNEIFKTLNNDISAIDKTTDKKAEKISIENNSEDVVCDVSDSPEGEFRNGVFYKK